MSPEDSIPLRQLLKGANQILNTEAVAALAMQIVLIVILAVCVALCVSAETSIPLLSESKLKKLSEEGNSNAKKLLAWLDRCERFCRRMSFGKFLFSLIALICSMFFFVIDPMAAGQTVSPVTLWSVLGICTLIFSVTCIYLPKRICTVKSEAFALNSVGLLVFLNALLIPFSELCEWLVRPLIRMFGLDPNVEVESVTEEEILSLVDAGEEIGSIEESTKDMISNIFNFDDRTVSELMTHRTEVTALEDCVSIDEAVNIVQEEGYSRIPVYHDDIDDIKGILYAKDLLRYVGNKTDSVSISSIIRPAYFVPSFKKCSELFTEMTEKKIQMAIVCDEYGGTYGIITMEDLIEAIVGNIQDEYDDEEEEISKINENLFTIDGGTAIDEVSDLLGIELPEGDYDTVGGFVLTQLGRIPEPDEQPVITYENIVFTVQLIEDRRIVQILVERLPIEEEDE